jgi:hypothetical protein
LEVIQPTTVEEPSVDETVQEESTMLPTSESHDSFAAGEQSDIGEEGEIEEVFILF